MRVLRSGVLLLAGLGAAACAEEGPRGPFQARFAVRGRWPGERVITWRYEPGGGAVGDAESEAAIRSALDAWSATGCVRFEPAAGAGEPDLVFAWREGAHGSCPAFGADPGVAHAGPVARPTFVHFDAARPFGSELSLRQAALHEVGHVLGLDHSPDEEAAMYPEPSRARDRLAASDLAGIHSLYGGGADGDGDVGIQGEHEGLVLRGVAPPEVCEWALFDTDGDGDEEVLVWRTDDAGHGALWTYHFDAGPRLARTRGPVYGVTSPGFTLEPVRTAAGERLLVLRSASGAPQARIFDGQGTLAVHLQPIPSDLPRVPETSLREGDLDGDGRAERVARRER